MTCVINFLKIDSLKLIFLLNLSIHDQMSCLVECLCYKRAQFSTKTHILEVSLDFIESSAFLSSVHIVFAS